MSDRLLAKLIESINGFPSPFTAENRIPIVWAQGRVFIPRPPVSPNHYHIYLRKLNKLVLCLCGIPADDQIVGLISFYNINRPDELGVSFSEQGRISEILITEPTIIWVV